MTARDEKTILFRIRRFNPERNEKTVSEFKVPVKKGTTLLDAFLYIKDNLDETFAFRHSCRMGVCGSCGVMVNGKPELACYTQVLHLETDTLEIAPLQSLPVIKDLIVDIEPFFEKYKCIENVLIRKEAHLEKPQELSQTPTDLKKFWDMTMCIKCSICYSSCPAILDERFLGPATLTTNYRFITDSRDEGSERRLKPMTDNLWLCTSCNSCTLFCPKEVNCSDSIVNERGLVVETGVIPRTAMEILSNTMKFHNPLGRNQIRRTDWANELEIRSYPETIQGDALYFVGCLASFDPRNQEISRALVSMFNHMNIDFFTLGTEEWCCGDHILRLGEAGLFEELADHNLSVFKKTDFKRLVTLSPHCFDAFKNNTPY
ncbi:MAG: succinate dehydrogenase iron-sulfur subunit, partial [Candidatus Bathyarchaeota archaeon]